jgi:hypothetical protein
MEREPSFEIEQEQWKDIEEYWGMLLDKVDEDDVEGAEYLLLHRDDFHKLPGEDELFGWLMYEWLEKRLDEKLGRSPLVELNEKGVIAAIKTEEKN